MGLGARAVVEVSSRTHSLTFPVVSRECLPLFLEETGVPWSGAFPEKVQQRMNSH
jgi:hypothetical protein